MQSMLAIKRFNGLKPADDAGKAVLADIKDGETVRISITKPSRRSLAQHRLFFALLDTVAEQIGWTTEQVLTWTKIATGHCDILVEPRTGRPVYSPRSISFARMSGDDFRVFMELAVDRIHARLLPAGTERRELVEEAYSRVDNRP